MKSTNTAVILKICIYFLVAKSNRQPAVWQETLGVFNLLTENKYESDYLPKMKTPNPRYFNGYSVIQK